MLIRLCLLSSLLLVGCSDGSDGNIGDIAPEPILPDFSQADAWLENFIATEELYPGGSMAIVDKNQGVIHKVAMGDQDEDSVVLLASLSKVPTVSLLMALDEDDAGVDFDMAAPIANYLPWMGVWDSAITTEHLVSNRSGIPGLQYFFSNPVDYFAHICQYESTATLLGCVETLYSTPLPNLPSNPANTAFDYGGSQWQISGGIAELVGGGNWGQLWNQYIADPCNLELARYGNNLIFAEQWDGNPDSLVGLENPNMEAGLMSNLDDYAKLVSMHLNEGACGDRQVLSPEGVAAMREERTPVVGEMMGYGMGWWVIPPREGGSIYLYVDIGLYSSIAWVDTERNYGGVVFFEEYTGALWAETSQRMIRELIPLIEEAIDAVR